MSAKPQVHPISLPVLLSVSDSTNTTNHISSQDQGAKGDDCLFSYQLINFPSKDSPSCLTGQKEMIHPILSGLLAESSEFSGLT